MAADVNFRGAARKRGAGLPPPLNHLTGATVAIQ